MLGAAGCELACIDLAVERLDSDRVAQADLIGLYIGMHTATRIALEALPRIRARAPAAHVCVYGLYAPMNESLLRDLGVDTVLGGEFEPGLLALAERVRTGQAGNQREPVISLSKVDFLVPDRSQLPPLEQYAQLIMPDGTRKTVGFVEASRGCKHLCRHCPVVPVYQGKFRIVPVEIVLADSENQVAAGASHLSFGDPDFLNGPTHALRIVRALHQRFPELTYDATIKIEHLIEHRALLRELRETGCIFITSAVESVEDEILGFFDKGHTDADFGEARRLLLEAGIALAPTFVAFTPWTTLEGYLRLLRRIVELRLVENVPPVQLSIRLLVPQGSHLFNLPGFDARVKPFDSAMLGYPWVHPDPRVDQLQKKLQQYVARADTEVLPRRDVFQQVWTLAHQAAGKVPPKLADNSLGEPIPRLSEPWYCCAEPTSQQFASF
jgi:radical SAM superfamily enzyme YgiQ (UPF0313 family)